MASANLSAWVYPGSSGRLLYQPDALGNRVLDFSEVGYRGGGVPLPNVPVKAAVAPGTGDDGARIQAAIDQVSALPLDTNGFRGAVLLVPGEYQIAGSLSISASGVVLRGLGDETNQTVLRATGAGQRSLIKISGSGSASTVSDTTHNLTDLYVPVGARSFHVDSTNGLAMGDRVFVRRIATEDWIHDLGMDLLGPPPEVNPWTPSGYMVDFDRIITRLEGNRVFINAPITCAIEQRYGGGTIRRYTWPGRIQNVGVENLRGVSDFVSSDDEDHGWIFVQVNNAENVWVRGVTSQYFGYACVALYRGTHFATVRDCRSLSPVSIITGGRRYAFVMDDCQLCLVQNCYTEADRHQFVTQSLTIGPNVFVDGVSDSAHSDAGPHHRWATGALWDDLTVNGNSLNIQNRGDLGSGHGWAGANCVAWNCYASGGFVVQNPPTARNWLIGSIGRIKDGTVYVGPHDPGTYDSAGSNVFPNSLYYTQLQDRLASPQLETREYWLGDLDNFATTNSEGDTVDLDPAWRSSIQSVAGSADVRGFDVVADNQWIPFTFDFELSTNERIVAATLSVAMRSAGSGTASNVLFLDSSAFPVPLGTIGWLPVGQGTNTTVRVLDLADHLDRLADGRLNVALEGDLGVDWALLQLEVAPLLNTTSTNLLTVADAFVRGGTSASQNFGTEDVFTLKEDSSDNYDRKAYLRWDLSEVTGQVLQARVRLTPVNVGTSGMEHCAAIADSSSWNEGTITWNNQPGAGKRFVSWIPAANVPVQFTVTSQVQEALSRDRQFSLQLFSLSDVGGLGLTDYASRENANPLLRPQLVLTFAVPATNPWGFQDVDIGGVDPHGTSAYASGEFTLQGGGNDIWGTADQCHFACVPVTNNDCEIIARVTSLDPVNAWTKCGVMIRQTLDADSPQAMVVITPSHGVNFMYRPSAGGSTSYSQTAGPAVPVYLKLMRYGNHFSAWLSSDSVSWTRVGTTQTIPVSDTTYAGLCLSSHEVGTLAKASLDKIQVVSPLQRPILGTSENESNKLNLIVAGPSGPDYTIQMSTNLVDWENVFTTNSPQLPFTWSDDRHQGFRWEFYRVVIAP